VDSFSCICHCFPVHLAMSGFQGINPQRKLFELFNVVSFRALQEKNRFFEVGFFDEFYCDESHFLAWAGAGGDAYPPPGSATGGDLCVCTQRAASVGTQSNGPLNSTLASRSVACPSQSSYRRQDFLNHPIAS